MRNHTPGPWVVLDVRTEGVQRLGIASPSNHPPMIARIESTVRLCPISEEDEANARLIAAAPELLAALKTLLDSARRLQAESGNVRRPDEWAINAAVASIAKAEGRTP